MRAIKLLPIIIVGCAVIGWAFYVPKLGGGTTTATSTSFAISGDKVTVSLDKAQVEMERWGGEEKLVVSRAGTFAKSTKLGATTESIILDKADGKESFVVRTSTEGVEMDIILNEKPLTNKFDFQIAEAEDMDFFYQPPLSTDEIEQGFIRPENVIGSYAVYSKTKANYEIGKTNYGTGKLFHIYRPEVIDALGNKVWGVLDYTNGILSVSVDQKFLDTASYPVTIDPDFGNFGDGATQSSNCTDCVYATRATAPESGFVVSISMRAQAFGTPANNKWKALLITSSTLTITDGKVGNETVFSTTSIVWTTSTFSSYPAITGGVNYDIGSVRWGPKVSLDTTGSVSFFDTTNNYASPTDPTDAVLKIYKISFYATYTTSVTTPPPQTNPIFFNE